MFHALASVVLACSHSASAAAQPTLEHSAPFLGHALDLDVAGAAPLEPAVLYYGPRRGAVSTPFGTFEIERSSARLVARTTTDAQGQARFTLQVPAAASYAEDEAHFQALIDDPAAPSGKTFSQGVHVRLLGTRVYCGTLEYGAVPRSGMEIVSAVRGEVVAGFPFASASPNLGRPVFRRDFGTGAMIAEGNSLVLFDPFFGSIRTRIAFASPQSKLLEDAGGERFYVLEPYGRITAVDFASGQILGTLDLPVSSAGPWCENDDKTEAYVGVSGGGQAGPAVRRVDLAQLTDLGAIPVGGIRERIGGIEFADRHVAVTSHRFYYDPHWQPIAHSSLSVIDLSGSRPVVSSQSEDELLFGDPVVSAAADQILVHAEHPYFGGPPNYYFLHTSLSHVSPLADAGYAYGYPPLELSAMIAQDSGVWISGCGPWDNCFGILLYVDLVTLSWTPYPSQGWYPGPRALAVARDGYVDDLYVAIPRYYPGGWPPGQEPELFVIDHLRNGERHIPLQHSPSVLRAVEVP